MVKSFGLLERTYKSYTGLSLNQGNLTKVDLKLTDEHERNQTVVLL